MACMLRGLWIFHAESDVRLIMSRRFPTVEKKMQRLLGEDYVALPSDEDINVMFITEVLHEEEDHYIPAGIPEPFHDDFRQGSFAWNARREAYAEKLWPMGPIGSICKGRLWPVLFVFKKGFYLVTVVALERKYKIEQVRALELPQITAAFAVLEDICDFIPASLTIADIAGISELQYYIRSAIPFGSPMNTNYHLLRMVRHGFPNKGDEETLQQRSPAWKPYLYKGKAKLTLSIIETVNCMLYGKPEYEDECFIAGTVYCCADVSGVPEIVVPISYQTHQTGAKQSAPPEISVHNCAHIVGDIRAAKSPDSLKISCTPPTGPFVLCRYRYAASPVVPVRGFYQIKEMSPVEFRVLLQVQFHPVVASTFWSCQVRLPFHHRGLIKSHDLKCSGGSFSVTDQGHSILWNLNVRRPRGHLETNLLGELIFEASQGGEGSTSTSTTTGAGGSGTSGAYPAVRTYGELGSSSHLTGPSAMKYAGAPQLGVGGTLMVNRSGNAVIIGSALTPSGGLMYAQPSSTVAGREAMAEVGHAEPVRHATTPPPPAESSHNKKAPLGEWMPVDSNSPGSANAATTGGGRGASASSGGSGTSRGGGPGEGGASGAAGSESNVANTSASGSWSGTATQPAAEDATAASSQQEERSGKQPGAASQPVGLMQDPFLRGVNCYAEVFLEVPDTTLSGIMIDPKAVSVYPTTRVYGGVAVQKEVLTGKYVIWNMAGEVRGHHSGLQFEDCRSGSPALSPSAAAVGPTPGATAGPAAGESVGFGQGMAASPSAATAPIGPAVTASGLGTVMPSPSSPPSVVGPPLVAAQPLGTISAVPPWSAAAATASASSTLTPASSTLTPASSTLTPSSATTGYPVGTQQSSSTVAATTDPGASTLPDQ
eukprot:TRINITY_DN2661_c0_g1_i1.p1 TRINITY_DN2661_c0_g1~~TRINITY_DN2661_c0_g1_i1.p1  ORF type:complete len:883 (-),score=121.99 TRINITY_DN2661_c0_g1_i1:21-2669(-)